MDFLLCCFFLLFFHDRELISSMSLGGLQALRRGILVVR